ncbi:MAG: transporter substrate-binding domain-containing protein [Candidatus Cloacimonetes bacterium]|nr:transporter substrate-binding domain-containing protein [Candidatus Cloacimonadota bacterium]
MKFKSLFLLFVSWVAILVAVESEALPKLVIGGDYNYPPYEFINGDGEPDGYNVDLSRAICRELGYEPEFKLAKWSLVRSWLEEGSIDLLQGMAYSLGRAQEIHFSNAHTSTWRGIFVPKGSDIEGLQDDINLTVVIQKDDVAADYLRQIDFQGRVSQVSTQEEALKLLNDGVFDAAVTNYMMSMYIIRRDNLHGIKALPNRINQRDYCYAGKDEELIKAVNAALDKLSGSGELLTLQDKWFSTLDHSSSVLHNGSLLPWYLLALSLLIIVCLLYFWYRCFNAGKHTLKALAKEQSTAEELENDLTGLRACFVQGPVIQYKMEMETKTVLAMSDSISQWGYTKDEIIGPENCYEKIIYSEDLHRVRNNCEDLMDGDSHFSSHRIVTKSGDLRWVLDYARLLRDEHDGKLYLYGYGIDVTDQKNLEAQMLEAKEKAEAANIAKSHFLANMSHEIRTPLNGINGFLQVLMQMHSTPDQREIFDLMYSSSRNLMKIINDILDFSKIEAGKMELIISEFNPKYMIDDLVKQYSFQNRKSDLEIKMNVSSSLPDALKGDQLRLKQILMNLIQNALKFTDSGYIEIGAELYTISEGDVRILFRVTDTGIGIDPVKQKDIFDNYTQAESNISLKYGGTGLGLAIVKKLVEMMQGFIWVESEPGKGSCFFFILPFTLHKEVEDKLILERIPLSVAEHKLKGKILLVEDEAINQLVTKRQLELWGLQVEIAQQGEEAIDMHRRNPYDLIMMDIQLPVMDGVTATKKIRAMEQTGLRKTPIVAFTAAALLGDRERFMEQGMDDYIAKPVDMNELYNILAKLLEQ